jgi:hypothetical protein
MSEKVGRRLRNFALYGLRYSYLRFLDNFGDKIKFIHPDLMSFIAFFIAILIGFFYYKSGDTPVFLLINIFLIFLWITLNTLVEVLSMKRAKFTIINAIIYALPDRYADLFVIVGISFSSLCDIGIGMIASVTILLISYTGMLGKALGVSWQHQGPLDKTDRLVILMAASFLQYLLSEVATPSVLILGREYSIMELCMVIFILLGQITILMRVKGILSDIKEVNRTLYREDTPEEKL